MVLNPSSVDRIDVEEACMNSIFVERCGIKPTLHLFYVGFYTTSPPFLYRVRIVVIEAALVIVVVVIVVIVVVVVVAVVVVVVVVVAVVVVGVVVVVEVIVVEYNVCSFLTSDF